MRSTPNGSPPSARPGSPASPTSPSGGGPRLCIGNQLALAEAQLILATIVSRYRLRLAPGTRLVPQPLVTLRPRGGLRVTVHRSGGVLDV